MPDRTVFVSRRSHEQGVRPGFVYREEPDDERDSGWRAMVGDETAAEADDPLMIVLLPLGELLERWPELQTLVEGDPRSGAWAWDSAAERYAALPPEVRPVRPPARARRPRAGRRRRARGRRRR